MQTDVNTALEGGFQDPDSTKTRGFGSTLVLIQDMQGRYVSFQWQQGQGLLRPEMVLEQQQAVFAPVDADAYQDCIRQVLSSLSPERFSCPFHCGDRIVLLEGAMSPVLLPDRAPEMVVVAGRLLPAKASALPAYKRGVLMPASFMLSTDRYQKLLTQISWNIRRTLDLPTIWQQTVKGLAKALGVSRCLVCLYKPMATEVEIVAEHVQETSHSIALLGRSFSTRSDDYLREAIATLKTVTATDVAVIEQEGVLIHRKSGSDNPDQPASFVLPPYSMLVQATCYQDRPNALILLYQSDHSRCWSGTELEFMRDLADQVGTAIAHANLFADSQSLTEELQRVNSSLMQKHRELEEARHHAVEASRLKSEFLANTSHELRTPLNGMIGFLKLVLDGMADDPEEQTEFISEAYRSAIHLLNIINDVLDLAKIEAGKLQIDLSPVKLVELLSDVEDFLKPQAFQKNLHFEIEQPPTDDEILLFGNYQRLLQVMLNLVSNAIKFTHEGGINISVELIRKKVTFQGQDLPGMAIVRVADTGIGVSLDKQDKLFQSFSQVDGSRTRQYGGTGLGLAISQKLVEAMGGEVNFFSMGEGLGSTVTFTVPLFQEPLMITSQFTDVETKLQFSE